MSIAVIAGLGNPGKKYRNTRHNIGFEVVDGFLRQFSSASWKHSTRFEADLAEVEFASRKLLLLKPLTFMNDSGRSLGAVFRYYKIEPAAALIVYDDITLEFARAKLSIRGSHGGHNGIRDILERVGSGFARYRVGIGSKPEKAMDLADYVLSDFKPEEKKILEKCYPDYYQHLRLIIDKGIEPALNIINQRTFTTTHERNQNEQL